ncbi:MAG: GAF domain-containing protein, partial [Chloroflexi bacterium]|nr:GAF domain-containing protein [Chloroflexota bacterium]
MDRRQLSILIVDESDRDAVLLERVLRQEGYDLTSQRVDTAESLRRALRTRDWDLVVSECRLPRFSAYKALETIGELALDIPLIVVSETVDEIDVVALVKAGAVDFIRKDNVSLLASTVKREIRASGRRREEMQAELDQQQVRAADVERANAQAQKLTSENAVIAEIGRVISSTLKFDAISVAVAEHIKSVVPYDRLSMAVLVDDGDSIRVRFVDGIQLPGREAGHLLTHEQSVTVHAPRTGKGHLFELEQPDAESPQSMYQQPFYDAGLKYGLAVPLVSNGQLVGSMVFRSLRPDVLTRHELRLAERIAALVAGALAADRLYQQTQREARENGVLAAIGRAMGSTLDIKTVYDCAFDALKDLMPVDRLSAALILPDGEHLATNYISGLPVPKYAADEVYLIKDVQLIVIDSKVGHLWQGDEYENLSHRSIYIASGLRSQISVPLISEDKVIGMMWIRSKKRSAYSTKDLALAERVGLQISGAVAKSILYEETQRQAEEREVVAEIGRIISSSQDVQDVFNGFAEQVSKVVSFDRVSIGT